MLINVGRLVLSMGNMKGERKMCLRMTNYCSHVSVSPVTTMSGAQSCTTSVHMMMIT